MARGTVLPVQTCDSELILDGGYPLREAIASKKTIRALYGREDSRIDFNFSDAASGESLGGSRTTCRD